MNTHAVLYNCGKLILFQIVYPEKKFTVSDGVDESGKMKFREPKFGDDCSGYPIVFLGDKKSCESYINKNH